MNVINKIMVYWKEILIVISLILVLFLGGKLIKSNDRLIIYNDSIQVLKNKAGELYSRVNYYQVSEKELKQVNLNLYNEVNKLKDKPLNIETVTTKAIIKDLPLKAGLIDSTFSAGNAISLLIKDDTLKHLEISTKLYLSQTEKNGKMFLNARSDFPNLTFTDIEGYNLNPLPVRKKRFGIGLIIGIDYRLKPTVGVGVSYSFFNF